MSKEGKPVMSAEKDIDSGNTRFNSDENVRPRTNLQDWLAIGDWVAAGERWAFALSVPQPLFKERQAA